MTHHEQFSYCFQTEKNCSLYVLKDGEVDRATIEEYVELEKKIAGAETHSPALILQQKKDQLVRRRRFGRFH